MLLYCFAFVRLSCGFLCCPVLFCVVWYCMVLHYRVLHWFVLYDVEVSRIGFGQIVLSGIVSYYGSVLHCVRYCVVLCSLVYCYFVWCLIALLCFVLRYVISFSF